MNKRHVREYFEDLNSRQQEILLSELQEIYDRMN